jgi:Holliday junction resolvase RusA-like endonuclease
MVESSKALAPWRDTVTNAAYGAGPKLDGPVATLIIFTLPRPKSAPKRETLPQRGIDLDKAVRGVCDSITAAGLWEDDSRVCTLIAYKRWPAPSDALPVPGVVVACTRQSSSDWYDNETLLRLCIDQHRAAWGRYQQEVPA